MFNFYVSVNTSDAEVGALPIFKNISKIQEARLKSKPFASYKDCIDTAHLFVSDIIEELNTNGGKYFTQTAFNPALGEDENVIPGVGQLAEWPEAEIFRFYVVNGDHKDQNNILITKIIVSVLSYKHNQKDH
jgi:hypothetical protein